MTTVSTHVLDAVLGRPAAGITVVLGTAAGVPVAEGVTDPDGRIRYDAELTPGDHRLTFTTGAWFAAQDRATFHPEVSVAFTAVEGEHHHVALLLSPYSYTTYRGS